MINHFPTIKSALALTVPSTTSPDVAASMPGLAINPAANSAVPNPITKSICLAWKRENVTSNRLHDTTHSGSGLRICLV